MKLIGENIHIISKKTRTAIENRDKEYIQDLAKKQIQAKVDWIDLNIGPARRNSEGIMNWLAATVLEIADVNFSFDTSNLSEIKAGMKIASAPQNCIVNSASGDPERLENMVKIAADYNSYLIALTMNNESGIPGDAEGRLEIAYTIMDKAAETNISNTKILMDPLVLPVSVAQKQVLESLNSIRMFKESFDPAILTTIGLSNISNGSPKEIRPLINRVFAVMAMGCGLDSAIVDILDPELIRINNVIESQTPQKDSDKLLINLHNLMHEFGDLEDISYNADNPEEEAIYKTARILLNKNIYTHNYL